LSAGKTPDPGTVVLRTAEREDLEFLARLDEICFPADHTYSVEEMEWFVIRPRARTVLALRDGLRVAFATLLMEGEASAHIATVEVHPDHRGAGLATILLHDLERWAAEMGIRRIFLEVDCDNTAAISLYESFGYLLEGEFVELGRERYRMARRLG